MDFLKLLGMLTPIIFGILFFIKEFRERNNIKIIGTKLGITPLKISNLSIGLLIGVFIFTLIFSIYYFTNLLVIKDFSWDTKITNAIFDFILVAIFEEFISRSLFINGLQKFIKSTYIIIFITALFFSLAHLLNNGADLMSSISTFLGGVMYAYAFIKTKNIWLPIGLHFSWNFVQGCIFGFFVSGYYCPSLLKIQILGSDFLTGDEYGPEGGFIGIIARLVIIFILWKLLKNKSRP